MNTGVQHRCRWTQREHSPSTCPTRVIGHSWTRPDNTQLVCNWALVRYFQKVHSCVKLFLCIYVYELQTKDPIHRHCPKIYPKTCHDIILWQKLRCHKMILRHTLSQFTKFVLGARKIWRVTIVAVMFVNDCVYDTGTRTHFTRSFRCLPVPVPPFDQLHSAFTILPLMLHHLGRGRQPLSSAD